MIKIASFFAGIGGFEKGIQQASDKIGIETEFVFASEIEKNARTIYTSHFGGEHLHGDIKEINAADVPDHDILCGGFPCQDVSIAGKRAGLFGERTGLFFELIRILRVKQPQYVLLENVKGLLSSNGGWDFARVIIELENAGYTCEWQVLNAANFGLAQNRKRVFIIGHLGTPGRSGSQILPFREDDQAYNQTGQNKQIHEISTCLTSGGNDKWNGTYIAHCLTAGGNSGGLHSDMDVIVHNHAPRSGDNQKGGTGHLSKKGDHSYTLCGHLQSIQMGIIHRRFTPIEWERLMGFPDNWTLGVSNTSRFKCLGNSVPVNVIQSIAERLLEAAA